MRSTFFLGGLFLVLATSSGLTGCAREAEEPTIEAPQAADEGLRSMGFEELVAEGNARLEAEDVAGALEVLAVLESTSTEALDSEQQEARRGFVGDVSFDAGVQAWREGDYDKAFADFDRAAAFFDSGDERNADLNELKAIMAHERGELDLALSQYELLVPVYETLGDEVGIARSVLGTATVYCEQGLLQQARPVLAEAIDRFEALEFPEGVGTALVQLGIVDHHEGNLDAASSNYDRARGIFVEEEIPYRLAAAMTNGGEVDLARGQPLAAIERFRNALVVHHQDEDSTWIAYGTVRLAEALTWAGRQDEASAELATLELEKILDPSTVAEGQVVSAWIELTAGRLDTAAERARSAVEALEGSERRDDLLRLRLFAGEVALLRGEPERVRTLLEASSETIAATESRAVRWRAEGLTAQLRALDPAATEDALAELATSAREAAAAGHVALAAELALDRVEVALRAGDRQKAEQLLATLLAEHEGSEIVDHLRTWGAMLERSLVGSGAD